jgi:hypothetical protein
MKRSAFIRKPPEKFTASVPVPRKGIKRKVKSKTKAERERMGIVAGSFCIVCRNEGLGESPAELHHPRFLAGGGQRSSHMDVIALCPAHHRLGGYGVAIHAGQEEWERRYGTEAKLLKQTRRELGIEQPEMEIA